jgi:hypothetical protein
MKTVKEIVIPKEDAVFWMDGNGRWHNVHGPFRHRKLIRYFNAAIRKDADGFFVEQERGDVREKVYFRCGETAFFAVDITTGSSLTILLNTGESVKLEPQKLYIENDCLFMHHQESCIQFTDRCMMMLSGYIHDVDGACYFRFNDKKSLIPKGK